MDFGRIIPRTPLKLLNITVALLLALCVTLFLYLVIDDMFLGQGGSPYDANRISGVAIWDGGAYSPSGHLPPTHFRCQGQGLVRCAGTFAGERLSFNVGFNGGWSCSGFYAGQAIACQGAFNTSNNQMVNVSIKPSELGLTNNDLRSITMLSLVTPYRFMRVLWPVIGVLYIFAIAHHFMRPNRPAQRPVEPWYVG